jgi:hypothetical protein
VQQVAARRSAVAASRREKGATRRKALGARQGDDDSAAIDTERPPPATKEPTMNRNALPRTSITTRFQALFAAAVLTVATLSGIGSIASSEGSNPLIAQSTVSTHRA